MGVLDGYPINSTGGSMTNLSLLLFQNGLPDLPVVLIEPHRNHGGIWRIKFSYDTDQPLSMSAGQAAARHGSRQPCGLGRHDRRCACRRWPGWRAASDYGRR
jgi:hypothetical protein